MPNYDNLISVVNNISQGLDRYKNLVDCEHFEPFQSGAKSLSEDIEKITEEGRNLRIGIIGAVKAGKSSFLNALIFDGEDVLPKAETPMTASLTKITYSKTQTATVFFFSRETWEGIEKNASIYEQTLETRINGRLRDIHEQNKASRKRKLSNAEIEAMREEIEKQEISGLESTEMAACYELVEKARVRDTNPPKYYGKSKTIDYNDLERYIGANGKYAPIVQHIEIKLNSPELQGLEIIDTPGLNDPVISRTQLTLKFIKDCDVVFLLSRSSRFLEESDMNLLRKNLPDEGVRDACLVATKVDSAMRDKYKMLKTEPFDKVFGHVTNENARRAIEELGKAEKSNRKGIGESTCYSSIVSKMREREVHYTSAIMYGIGKKIKNGTMLSEVSVKSYPLMNENSYYFKTNFTRCSEKERIHTIHFG